MNHGWKHGRVKDLIESLDSGVSVNGEDRIPVDQEPAVLKVSAVTYGVFNPQASKPILKEELKRARCNPKAGQIIISRASGTASYVGASVFIDRDYPYRFLPDKLWQTVPNPNIDTNLKWLAYFLASPRTRSRILSYATGTNIKNISQSELLALPVSIPPFFEQTAIADLLSTWDTAIEKTVNLISIKQEQRKGLMQQLLSGNQRVPKFSKPWQQVRLGDVFSNRTESGHTDLPLVSITGSEGVVFRDGLKRKDTSSSDKRKYLRINPGDIGYNTMRMWQGVVGLSQIEGIVSPAYTIVTPGDSLVPEFMALLFKFPPIVHLFYRYSQGLVSDTWNLKFRHFSEIRLRVPEKKEQEAIAVVFQPVDKEFCLLYQQLKAFKEQKRGLMQKLLTGQWRTKPFEIGDEQ